MLNANLPFERKHNDAPKRNIPNWRKARNLRFGFFHCFQMQHCLSVLEARQASDHSS
ncbi:MAG: hypothetical protein ACI9VN_003779, partial [Patescibacteria group bacterium]